MFPPFSQVFPQITPISINTIFTVQLSGLKNLKLLVTIFLFPVGTVLNLHPSSCDLIGTPSSSFFTQNFGYIMEGTDASKGELLDLPALISSLTQNLI